MASVLLNELKRAVMAGEVDLDAHDIRARLVMINTTCDTENDAIVTISNYTTPDKSDASGYADQALGSKAVTKIDATDRSKFSSASVVFSGLGGNATRNYQGILLYKYVSGVDAGDLALAYIDFTTPIPKEATQVTVPCPTDGWFYLN